MAKTKELRAFKEALGDFLRGAITSQNSQNSRDIARAALNWSIAYFARVLVGTADGSLIDKTNPNFDIGDYTAGDGGACSNNLRTAAEKLFSEPKLLATTLAAIHVRAPWLDDGRATSAATPRWRVEELIQQVGNTNASSSPYEALIANKGDKNDDPFLSAFHERLLQLYFRSHTRLFTLNDRLFENFNQSEELSATTYTRWDFRFTNSCNRYPRVSEEVKNHSVKCYKRKSISVPKKLLDELICFSLGEHEQENLREAIFSAASSESREAASSESRHFWQDLKSDALDRKLMFAIEMTWHRLANNVDSLEKWIPFFQEFKFIRSPQPCSTTSKRSPPFLLSQSLLQALWFLQGVSIYRFFGPSEISTVIFNSKFENVLFGITFGTFKQSKRECADRLNPALIQGILTEIVSIASGKDPESDDSSNGSYNAGTTSGGDLTRVLGLGDVAATTRETMRAFTPPLPEGRLAHVLRLSQQLVNPVHEQVSLYFRFFLGTATHLARFHELYKFSKREQDDFTFNSRNREPIDDDKIEQEQAELERSSLVKQALILRAHYSHLQDPSIGIFFEWEERIGLRIVRIAVPRHESGPEPLISLLALSSWREQDSGRATTAIELTKATEDLFVVDAGGGRIRVYKSGNLFLAWPDVDGRSWWSPVVSSTWNSHDTLRKFLEVALCNHQDEQACTENGKGLHRFAKILSNSLMQVSDSPGLGCALVIYDKEEEDPDVGLNRFLVPLNPKRFQWVDSLALSTASQQEIINTLIQDGATILYRDGYCLRGQQQLVAVELNKNKAYNPHVRKPPHSNPDRWTYGTRHASACDITSVEPRCIVITVSSDGPVRVFRKGKACDPKEFQERCLGMESKHEGES